MVCIVPHFINFMYNNYIYVRIQAWFLHASKLINLLKILKSGQIPIWGMHDHAEYVCRYDYLYK